ncbi:hypothetical protein GIB67_018965, partial [Kingdonia uniflora]
MIAAYFGLQEKIRVALFVQKAALQFIDGGIRQRYTPSIKVREAGFGIDLNDVAAIVQKRDNKTLSAFKGVEGIARNLSVLLEKGVETSELPKREEIYGNNHFIGKLPKCFWVFVWEALQDLTLIILFVCAIISIGLGISVEGWPSGMYNGLGIILCIFLVITITAVSDYKQYLQFKDLDREKKNILVKVTRDGYSQTVPKTDLVVGDVAHLFTGDYIPADGIYIYGSMLLIDESSLTGESDPVHVNRHNPFLLSGTTVQDGKVVMLVTAVGMSTEWGRLMDTLNEGGDDETPLQVKLNGVTTIIAKFGLVFAFLSFVVLMTRFLVEKTLHNEFRKWFASDALDILNYIAIAVTLVVIAVPEGLPLAVTLSLAYAMKKIMNDKALVRHLSACEAMGSASCICTDKTGTLTTSHMVVDKVWICEKSISLSGNSDGGNLKSAVSKSVLTILLQSIFKNTNAEVVKGKGGKQSVLGTPTESALLDFGLLLGGDFFAQRQESRTVMFEPFISDRKKTSILVYFPDGLYQAFCNGAPEVIVKMCDKIIDGSGSSVPLSEAELVNVMGVVNAFACEALRILCFAFRDMNESFDGRQIPVGGYTLLAVIGIKNPVRPGVKNAVQTCIAAGITVRMITGDNIHTAIAIAKECGILTDGGLAIEGPDFRSKTPQEMNDLIPRIQVMARSSPLDKYTLVTHLRKFGEVVAVTGDGTNDVPALHEADIGLAMGIAGTEVCLTFVSLVSKRDRLKQFGERPIERLKIHRKSSSKKKTYNMPGDDGA